ncbi:MAG: PrgI family protein [Lachnospiraceae bacterium]|nr:PrgI family protein [Lachnospiraceae bacterium]
MQIPVNKDIDDYKDDFFKGMTLRQTTMCVLTLAVGIGCYFLCNSVLGLPQTVSLYLVFPVALPFAAAGFLKIDGMPPLEYLKRRREVTQTPLYRYRPMVFERAESGTGDWMENYMTDGECLGQEQQDIDIKEATAEEQESFTYGEQAHRIKRKDRKKLLAPYEDEGSGLLQEADPDSEGSKIELQTANDETGVMEQT